MNISRLLSASLIFSIALLSGCASDDSMMTKSQSHAAMGKSDDKGVAKAIASWPERPRLGANAMMAKYGAPNEVTSERLIWHNAGPYKRITVFNLETPHDFPLPHVDFLEHTIVYNVPQEKVGDLIAFDASSTINRTVGELSARCDLEGHNILTLNLDHDIVTGKMTVEQARQAFGENVQQDVMGKHPAYVEKLQFTPAVASTAAFSDKPVIPGAPVRAADPNDALRSSSDMAAGDAEVLASLIAVDMNEVLAAAEAEKKKISQPVLEYAKMLHVAHGMHMDKTMKLGQQIGTTPMITSSVETAQKKGAGDLASMITLDGNAFQQAYLDSMVKGHTDALSMIDNELMMKAKSDALRQHVTATRAEIAEHLQKAKSLQASGVR